MLPLAALATCGVASLFAAALPREAVSTRSASMSPSDSPLAAGAAAHEAIDDVELRGSWKAE